MVRKYRKPEEAPVERRSASCCIWRISAAWTTSKTCSKNTIAEFMEDGLGAELDEELDYSRHDYKNNDTGNSRKTLCTSFGDIGVSVLRDRRGEFDPQVLKKNQTGVSQDIEEKILSMYAKWMTTGDIETNIRDIYGLSVSNNTVSRTTNKVLAIVR